MTYLPTQTFDVSLVTRIRLGAWDDLSPSVRVGVISWAIVGTLALAHLLTALLFLYNPASGQAAGFDRLPLDNAWVHLVYARSFAEKFAFEFNPGVTEEGATSPLWVMLVGLCYKVLAFSGVFLPAIAELLGIVLAFGTSLVAMKLVHQVTDSKVMGAAAAVLIALEPNYTFAKLSGAEAVLFGFLALAASWTFYSRRMALTGALLALAVAARPEGLLLVVLCLVALAVKLLWERGDFRLVSISDLSEVLKVALPPLLVVLALGMFYMSVNGTPYPSSYLAKHVPLGLLNLPNLRHVVQGYLAQTSFFGPAGVIAVVPLLFLASIRYVRQKRFAAIPLIAFPFLLCYALSVTIPLESGAWNITTRRYLDPALPFIAVGLVVGTYYSHGLLVALGMSLRRGRPSQLLHTDGKRVLGFSSGSAGAKWASLGLTLLFLLMVALPYSRFPERWVKLASEYSWNSRNIHEVNVAAARWIDQHLPPSAVIGTLDAGAIRFFGNRRVVDLTGANTHSAIGQPLFDAAEEQRIDYLVAFRNVYFDSWPWGEEVASFTTQKNTVLAGPELVVYHANWDLPVHFSDKSVPHTINTTGLRLLDSLDVGNQAQEESHFYALTRPGSVVDRAFNIANTGGGDIIIKDDARTATGSEEFLVKSEINQPLIIAKRYDAAVGGSIAVYVDDRFVGDWQLPSRGFVFGEDTFRVDPEFISNTTTRLRFEYIPSPGTTLNSFYYWTYTSE